MNSVRREIVGPDHNYYIVHGARTKDRNNVLHYFLSLPFKSISLCLNDRIQFTIPWGLISYLT